MKRTLFLSLALFATFVNARTFVVEAQTTYRRKELKETAASPFPYRQRWKEIETALSEGRYKSLLPQVDSIYTQASREGNRPEKVKAMLMQSQILVKTQETADKNGYGIAIANFEKAIAEIGGSETAAHDDHALRAVLQSLLANIYRQYEQSTRRERRNITELDPPPADIAEWTSRQLMFKCVGLYDASLKTPAIRDALKTEPSANWEQILTSDEDIDLFPTMYDILGTRYYNFLQHGNFYFMPDDTHKKRHNLSEQIIGSLIDFHQDDSTRSAYLNYRLMEIEAGLNPVVDTASGKADTLNTPQNAILRLAEDNKAEPFAAYLYYKAAKIYADSGDRIRAARICQSVPRDSRNKWSIDAANLLEILNIRRVQITMDEFNLPGVPIAVKVSATNTDTVRYKIYKYVQHIDKNGYIKEDGSHYKSGIWILRRFDDYGEHATTVKLDPLPQGYYHIETDLKDNEGDTVLSEELRFYVDEWTTLNLDTGIHQLLDRRTGKPVSDRLLTGYDKDDARTFALQTDRNGIFMLPLSESDDDYRDEYYLYNPKAKTYIELNRGYYGGRDEPIVSRQLEFFLDRAIYRPGQTLYFKGILYSKLKNEANVVKNETITIELHDVNDNIVSELQLTTNDYGSVFGEFILPRSGLTGQYSLHRKQKDRYGDYKYFRVEEYKRPKFEVGFDELKGEFTLGGKVTTAGKAESFAGAPLSEAKVVYCVVRREIFPYYRMWFSPRPASNETIVQGETTTDRAGKFEIAFKALPKAASKTGEYRTYTYTVYADVTDINGETRSAYQNVTVGDLPRMLSLQIPQKVLQKDFNKIVVNSTNLNGVKEDSKGTITLTQLIAPDRMILANKIMANQNDGYYNYDQQSAVGYQLYDKETFVKYFPHLPYSDDEMNPEKWRHGKVYNFDFDTAESNTIAVTSKLPKGFYRTEAYTLYGSDTIRVMKIIEILDDKTMTSTSNNFYSVRMDKSSYQVGEQITLTFLSDWKEATAIVNIESGSKWVAHRMINIRNGRGTLKLAATKQFLRDGLFVSSYLLKENGYKQVNLTIPITDKPRDLKITTRTFRDKISPGERETWELTVSGAGRDKAAAEVLAAMYDASLDEFVSNSYSFNPRTYNPYGNLYNRLYFKSYSVERTRVSSNSNPYRYKYIFPVFPDLTDLNIYYGGTVKLGRVTSDIRVIDGVSVADAMQEQVSEIVVLGYGSSEKTKESEIIKTGALQQAVEQKVQVRKNLQETAFFYPDLYTDENGDVKLTFTSPEALTKWKLLILAHTQDLRSGTAEFYSRTQKELMIVPNLPRFLREGDEVVVSAKINNLSEKDLSGYVTLKLYDALTDRYLSSIEKASERQFFNMTGEQNLDFDWKIAVPEDIQAIKYEIIATGGDSGFSDGEQGILPVLPNRMLVTETMPIFAKEGQTKSFTMAKLTADASTSANFNLTLSITTDPLWIAVMSLPYLREYPYECSEQIFSRLYGNILSTHIANSNPKIKTVFDNWNSAGHNVSPLEQNEELKNILLEETPWIHEAQSETEQRKRLALFFDLNKMKQEFDATLRELVERQNEDGGFGWFDGGKSNAYITGHIVQGFGQLEKILGDANPAGSMNAENSILDKAIVDETILDKAINYVDKQQVREIRAAEEQARKYGRKVDGKAFIHYYYVRSFWNEEYPLPAEAKKYLGDIDKDVHAYFTGYDLQRKAMIATVLHRYGFRSSAKNIINHLKETSVETDEMGMYWKDNRAGWLWYQSPVEAQAKAIEAFAEIGGAYKDTKLMATLQANIEEMKIWLMKNRQTNSWNSTKATTDAIYALTAFGKEWTDAAEGVVVNVGNEEVYNSSYNEKSDSAPASMKDAESLAGFVKKSWKSNEITPDKGIVRVEKSSAGIMWGGLYWQYFENLDRITQADSNVKMQKSLFLKKNTDSGPRLIPAEVFNVGDLVTVRIVISVDREMEYIHIKDMRAAGFEPVNVMSGYRYQNGCAYYESTRDAATNFFFERMTKGTYVFEYDLRANNAGTFSNGITTLQNMYAPEMSCHSAGMKVEIK